LKGENKLKKADVSNLSFVPGHASSAAQEPELQKKKLVAPGIKI